MNTEHFTNDNTIGMYKQPELDLMNAELEQLLLINNVASDDKTLIDHYSVKVIYNH